MLKDEQTQAQPSQRERMRDFFYHLIVYLFVLGVLAIVGVGGAFVWIALVWGFAVAAHGVYAYFGD